MGASVGKVIGFLLIGVVLACAVQPVPAPAPNSVSRLPPKLSKQFRDMAQKSEQACRDMHRRFREGMKVVDCLVLGPALIDLRVHSNPDEFLDDPQVRLDIRLGIQSMASSWCQGVRYGYGLPASFQVTDHSNTYMPDGDSCDDDYWDRHKQFVTEGPGMESWSDLANDLMPGAAGDEDLP